MTVTFLLCLLACAAIVLADLMDSSIFITTPKTVRAGTPFNATVNVQWHGLADSSYAYAFRIYLGSSYKEQRFYWYDSECYLVKEQSLCDATVKVFSDYIGLYDTPFTVTIPPTVGPSGAHYTLIGRILNTDGSYYGSTWESDVFELNGANGTWASYQKQNRQLWGDDGINCNGFACVKECAETSGTIGSGSGSDTYRACANACPDVFIDPSSSIGGQPTTSLTVPSACPEVSQKIPTSRTTDTGDGTPRRTSSQASMEPTAVTSVASLASSLGWVTSLATFLIVGATSM